MRRLGSLFGMVAIVLLSASLAGSASAGYWDVVYDLAPGSFLKTMAPGGSSDIDPITGSFTVRYDAATQSAPLSNPKMPAGDTQGNMYQPNSFFLMTGTQSMNLIPQVGGAPASITGTVNLNVAVVANSTTTGYMHCNENLTTGGQTGNCSLAVMTHSQPIGLTPPGSGPFPITIPKLVFTGAASTAANFTSEVLSQTAMAGAATVTLLSTYVGKEISRVWKPGTPQLPSISSGGLAVLGLWVGAVGVAGTLLLQRRRRAAKSE